MFFSTYVLTKKGPLAKIWLAAHWDKKLTRNEIRAIDLNQTIVQIVQPVVPIALRTSGELLIGVVRVYALKVKQLLKDATEATVLLRATNVQLVPKGMVKGGEHAKDAMSVTMDLVLSKGGAEELCEADFDGIADLLKGNKGLPKSGGALSDEVVVGNAWFTLEPSQYLEDQVQDSRELDEGIARIRADLLALGDEEGRRADSNGSKKSSISSVEKGRSSHVVLGDDMLDVGAPLPDDLLLSAIPDAHPEGLLDPGMMFEMPEIQGEVHTDQRLPKKLKVVNVLDAATTVLSKGDIEKCSRDRSDIVNGERRCGPLNVVEERDRLTIARATDGLIVSMEPISNIPNPALRAVFSSALKDSVAAARAAPDATRAAPKGRNTIGGELLAADAVDTEMPAPEFDFMLPEEEATRPSRKRGRAENAAEEGPFSASTIATMETLRQKLQQQQSITFGTFAKGLRRVEAARSFVDILALASHNVVAVGQREPFGEIALTRTPQLVS